MLACSNCGAGLEPVATHICKPRKRKITRMTASSAPVLKFADGDVLQVGLDEGLLFTKPGRYILLPVELWEATMRKALMTANAALVEAAAVEDRRN